MSTATYMANRKLYVRMNISNVGSMKTCNEGSVAYCRSILFLLLFFCVSQLIQSLWLSLKVKNAIKTTKTNPVNIKGIN